MQEDSSILESETRALRRVPLFRARQIQMIILAAVVSCMLGLLGFVFLKLPHEKVLLNAMVFGTIPAATMLWAVASFIFWRDLMRNGMVVDGYFDSMGWLPNKMKMVALNFQFNGENYVIRPTMPNARAKYLDKTISIIVHPKRPQKSQPLFLTGSSSRQIYQMISGDNAGWLAENRRHAP